MLQQYRTVYEGNEAEIVEKKSRFIAQVRPVHSEEEALAFIESVRKNSGMQGTTVSHLLSVKDVKCKDAVTMESHREQPENLCWM